jgi:hypothetical protein
MLGWFCFGKTVSDFARRENPVKKKFIFLSIQLGKSGYVGDVNTDAGFV